MSDVELLLRSEAARLRAPERLRERVLDRAAGVREPRLVLPPLRRLVLVAAPVVVAAIAAVALVKGVAGSGSGRQTYAAGGGSASAGATTGAHGSALQGEGRAEKSAPRTADRTRALGPVTGAPWGGYAPAVPTPTGRLTDYQATLRVRVRDLDRLTDASADAVRIARSLGGYAASVNTTTGNGPGVSYLELRVPASRVQEALLRLSGLGTVLGEQLSQRDLENVVARQNAQIAALRRSIRRIRVALTNPALPADVRVRLQIQLDEAKRALGQRRHAKKATLREAATAKISLELTTDRNAVAPLTKSRFDRSIDGAVDFLAGAGAVGLALLIGASPFIVLVALAIAGRRAWRRREERRLLTAQS